MRFPGARGGDRRLVRALIVEQVHGERADAQQAPTATQGGGEGEQVLSDRPPSDELANARDAT